MAVSKSRVEELRRRRAKIGAILTDHELGQRDKRIAVGDLAAAYALMGEMLNELSKCVPPSQYS